MATGNTPAKKAAPKSFSDLVNKEEKSDKTEEKGTSTETVNEEDNNQDDKDTKTTVPADEKNNNKNDNTGENRDIPVGPDNDKDDIFVEPEKRNTDTYRSDAVVHAGIDKTPDEMSVETPAETTARYNIDTEISDEDADNPRVQVYRDTLVNQVPSGTHLHPDVAKDLLNRGIAETHTDNAQVKRQVTEVYDFAPDADHNDKF